MKKTSIVGIAARLAAGIALVSSTALTAQATVFGTIAGDTQPTDLDDMFLKMHKQFDNINAISYEMIAMINDKHLVDPISADGFDFKAIGAQMLAAGMITDTGIWTDTVTVIEGKGFAAYVDQLQKRMSVLDKLLGTVGVKISHWAELDEDDRIAAVMENTDANIIPALAQLHTAVVTFQSYAMIGVLTFAQMSYIDNDTSSLVLTAAVVDKQPVPADA